MTICFQGFCTKNVSPFCEKSQVKKPQKPNLFLVTFVCSLFCHNKWTLCQSSSYHKKSANRPTDQHGPSNLSLLQAKNRSDRLRCPCTKREKTALSTVQGQTWMSFIVTGIFPTFLLCFLNRGCLVVSIYKMFHHRVCHKSEWEKATQACCSGKRSSNTCALWQLRCNNVMTNSSYKPEQYQARRKAPFSFNFFLHNHPLLSILLKDWPQFTIHRM